MKSIDIYRIRIAPTVNGLFVLVPASLGLVYYMAEAGLYYNNANNRRNNLPEMTSTDLLWDRLPMVVGIFLISSFITSRSSGYRELSQTVYLNLIGLSILVGIAVKRHTFWEIAILALAAVVSSSIGHFGDRLTRRCS